MIRPINKYIKNDTTKKITIYNQNDKLYEKYTFSTQTQFAIRDFR
jgi:hypothetical protein